MLILRHTAVLFLLAGIVLPANAGDMYKWKDHDGIWHFSSTPPADNEKFDTIELPAEPQHIISMRKLGTEREPEYAFFNQLWGPVELELKFKEAVNVVTAPRLPAHVVLPGRTEQRVLKVWASDPQQDSSFQLAFVPMIGPPLDNIPAEVNYDPPFPAGQKFMISQGFDNDITHTGLANQYAVDIVMPIGTPVLAARAGRVMELQDDFHGAGQQKRYLARANQIRILHDDGTMAVYAHLQANSLRVYPGAAVKRGQWIANSGNTGYSNGPHLHFVVQLNAGMSLQSLPFRFTTPAGGTMTPGHQMMIEGVMPKK